MSHSEPDQPVRKIDKVRVILEPLIAKFQASYHPGRNIAVDETMVGFRGRFAAKQYMPKNRPSGESRHLRWQTAPAGTS